MTKEGRREKAAPQGSSALEAGIRPEVGSRIHSSEAENVRPRSREDLLAPLATTISAGLYLVDFTSNICVLREYWIYYNYGKYHGYKDDGGFKTKPFFMCLGLMICGHIGTVIAFKLKLPPEQNPIRSAYFLPLIQFQRFVKGLIQTGCSRYTGPQAQSYEEAEALYAIVSAAIETGPQFALQFLVIVVVSRRVKSTEIPLTLLFSLIASFASGIYNTGRAVMFKLSKRWTMILNNVGIIGGIYTAGALVLRTVTMASVLNYWINYFPIGFASYFPAWLFPGSYLIGLLCVAAGRTVFSWSGQLHAIIFGYVNLTLGPLYPLVDGYRHRIEQDQNSPRKHGMKLRLGLVAALNLLLDVVPLSISGIIQQNPCNYNLADGERIITTLPCRNYLAYIITGVSVSVVTTLALLFLLYRVHKQESAAVCDEPFQGDPEAPALVAGGNQERPIRQSSREMSLVKTGSERKTVSPQPPSNLIVSSGFGSRSGMGI